MVMPHMISRGRGLGAGRARGSGAGAPKIAPNAAQKLPKKQSVVAQNGGPKCAKSVAQKVAKNEAQNNSSLL